MLLTAAVAQSVRAFALHARKVGCLIPSLDRPKTLEQVLTAPLPNALQQVRVSWVLGDDHYVIGGVAC